jgi:DNA topoisomerase-1
MERLHHNGVLVLPRYEGKGLIVKVREDEIRLTHEQEEMAVAWARKVGTRYVGGQVFARNFHRDLSRKLGMRVKPGEVDYSNVISFVEEERRWKASLSREERRRLAAQRKAQKESNKERYGYAWVDGVRVEVANYAVEPSCIFMGRGKHPLRGRWKEGPREGDIELNLSPDAPRPPGNWKGVLWQPDAMWVARWRDELTGKVKYVWFSESSILKQRKDIEKFDQAKRLRQNLASVQRHILDSLDAKDVLRRKIATVCFLVDRLKIRVGDEKDPDEADTVGASTLRPEHVYFNSDSTVTFNFLGKDAVRHVFRVELPNSVLGNLKEFAANAKSTLFYGVSSKHVSNFLDEVTVGLSAKVFRTCYASEAVETKLHEASVEVEKPECWKKYTSTMANLEAAKVCNHRRAISKTWKASLERKKIRLKALRSRAKAAQDKLTQKIADQKERYAERLGKAEERLAVLRGRFETSQRQLADRKKQGEASQGLRKRVRLQRERVARQRRRIRKLKSTHREQMKRLRERLKSRRQRDRTAVGKLKLQIKTQKETCDYNLGTSLKSYIDPRIYYEWGKMVGYDWKLYYPKALQRKFSWVERPH